MTEATGKQPPNAPVTIERLRSLLDAYGATPERWPEAERAGAAEAREALAAASRLNQFLDSMDAPAPSEALFERLRGLAPTRRPPVGVPPRIARNWRPGWWLGSVLRPAASALVGLAGLAIGLLIPQSEIRDPGQGAGNPVAQQGAGAPVAGSTEPGQEILPMEITAAGLSEDGDSGLGDLAPLALGTPIDDTGADGADERDPLLDEGPLA